MQRPCVVSTDDGDDCDENDGFAIILLDDDNL